MIDPRISNFADAISGSQSSSEKDIKPSDISITARSSRFQSETEQPIRTPTFSGSAKRSLGNQDLPKPAPRSSQSGTSVASKAPEMSIASSSVATKTTPSSTSATGKRVTNPRQNHGRAVAPPQLPGGHLEDKPINRSEELGVDFSQSPIAQRLLKYSKDYKGRYHSHLRSIDSLVRRSSDNFHSQTLDPKI